MKKSLLSLVALVFGAGIVCSVANALDIDDIFSSEGPKVSTAYTQLLNDYDSEWGYTDEVTVTCEGENEIITITSPKIEDSIFETATSYNLFVSPYRISQIKEGDSNVNNQNIIRRELKIEGAVDSATFKISSLDLDPNVVYYGFITPVDIYDQAGTPSKEFCFKINSNMCVQDMECDTFESKVSPVEPENTQDPENTQEPENTEVHGAGCAGMDLAHVSHTVNGDKLTLTWMAVDGDTVDIAILNPEEEVYEKLGTAKMSDEKFVYTMRWNGEQNFMLTNDCGSVKYKADAAIEKTPEKIVTPATGPAENILYIAIAAIVLYGAYAIFFRKSDN